MNRKLFLALACALALGACKQKGDEDQGTTQTTGANVQSDNTKLNERDRSGGAALPRDQSNATADIDVTARIRRSIIAHKGLSMDAKNVKIITRDGNVTLRGVVKDEGEKRTIQDEAQRVQGVKNVENQLDVLNR